MKEGSEVREGVIVSGDDDGRNTNKSQKSPPAESGRERAYPLGRCGVGALNKVFRTRFDSNRNAGSALMELPHCVGKIHHTNLYQDCAIALNPCLGKTNEP